MQPEPVPQQVLAGRRALVTGGATGMGAATARALADAGATVAAWDLDRAWDDTPEELSDLACLPADVSSSADVARAVQDTVAALGGLDIVVNNAAAHDVDARHPIWDVDEAVWDRVIGVNLTGTFLVSRATARLVKAAGPRGRIVNISSVMGRAGSRERAAYAASKAGIIALTQTTAQELAPYGATVNALCPGLMLTRRGAIFASGSDGGRDGIDALNAMARERVPARRPGLPAELAALVVFLASDAAAYITGEAIGLDGGMKTVFVNPTDPELP
ncbi:SDR family oxidoreductase [Baekduia soli]|uniref:SDR family oxidoreductase n=1 Tax=Baekduia soli TaxID=496014 RepID=A0A5B8U4S3_9ACTN|nr:SDR family NAD(P)-dependent oxidoreductase [Baekduia soli]QEC47941.1 SDR family oxidoreductase [Baekduia soli]